MLRALVGSRGVPASRSAPRSATPARTWSRRTARSASRSPSRPRATPATAPPPTRCSGRPASIGIDAVRVAAPRRPADRQRRRGRRPARLLASMSVHMQPERRLVADARRRATASRRRGCRRCRSASTSWSTTCPAAAAPAGDRRGCSRPAAWPSGVKPSETIDPRPRPRAVEHAPAADHLPRLPRPPDPVTAMTSHRSPTRALLRRVRRRCRRRGLLLRRGRARRRDHDRRLARSSRPRPPRAPASVGPGRAVAARRRRRALARGAARRPRLLRGPPAASPYPPTGCSPRTAMFGLHPALAPLLPLWTAGKSPPCTPPGCRRPTARTSPRWRRSRTPTPARRSARGWLNRLIGTDAGTSPLQGFAMGGGVVPDLALRPAARDVGRQRRRSVQLPGDDEWRHDQGPPVRSLHTLWDGDAVTLGTRDAVDVRRARRRSARSQDSRGRRTARRTPAPTSARRSPQAARVIRADVGVEVITVDQGDWDMHTDMGTVERRLDGRTTPTTSPAPIAAFFADLGDQADKVTLVTISEFGRRVDENASSGTRPRLRQRDVRRRRRRQGRQLLRHAGRG